MPLALADGDMLATVVLCVNLTFFLAPCLHMCSHTSACQEGQALTEEGGLGDLCPPLIFTLASKPTLGPGRKAECPRGHVRCLQAFSQPPLVTRAGFLNKSCLTWGARLPLVWWRPFPSTLPSQSGSLEKGIHTDF